MPGLPSLLNHSWHAFCFAVLLVFIQEILRLRTGRPDYDSFVVRGEQRPILVVCLKLSLKEDDCEYLETKRPFDCEMKFGLSCHTKGWTNYKKTYVISQIQRCEIERQILIYNDTIIRPEYEIHQDLLCMRFAHEHFSAHLNDAYYFTFNASSRHDYFIDLVESVRMVAKSFIWHRKCFFNPQTQQFNCRNADISLFNAEMVRKKHSEIRNCANYGLEEPYKDFANQFECLRKCYKDLGSNASETQKKQCKEQACPLIDCVFSHFYVDEIAKSDQKLTQVKVMDLIQVTAVIDFITGADVLLYVVGILSSLFGFNVLHQAWSLQRAAQHQIYLFLDRLFKEHHQQLKQKNDKIRKYVQIGLISTITLICVYQLGKSLCRYLRFEEKLSFTYDLSQSLIQSGITVSICFPIEDIQVDDSKRCGLYNCTLRELGESTLAAADLVEYAELSTVVRDQLLAVNESRWFFKDKAKCFDFGFKLDETKLEYYSRLIYIGIGTKRYFKHVYLREKGFYPTFSMLKQPSPNLAIYTDTKYRNNVFLKTTCKNYKFERDGCYGRQSCIEKCIRDAYLNEHQNAFSSHFIVTQDEIEQNETIGKLRFTVGRARIDFERIKERCESKFLFDCEVLVYKNFNISYEQLSERLENSLKCEFQLLMFKQSTYHVMRFDFTQLTYNFINLANLWLGISLPLLVKWLINWSYCFKLRRLSGALKNLLILVIVIVCMIHLKSFVDLIIRNQTISQMHLLETSSTGVPRVSLCLKFKNRSRLGDFDGLTPAEIDRRTPSINELVDFLQFYDLDFNEILVDRTNFSKFKYKGKSYPKMQKKKTGRIEDAFKIKTFFLGVSKCFDLIILIKYNQIDYRLHRSPALLRVQVNSSFESVVVVLNDGERTNLENWHRLHQNENLEFSFKLLKFQYTDNLYYLKRPLELIWPRKILYQKDYFKDIHYEFFLKHNRTTTTLPLTNVSYFKTEIDNQLFKKFYTSKSADELDLDEVRKLPAVYKHNQYVEIIKTIDDLSLVNDMRSKTSLKIYPHFLRYSLVVTNKQTRCDLLLYFTLICTLYLNVSFVQLPFFLIRNLVYLCRLFRRFHVRCCNFFKAFLIN